MTAFDFIVVAVVALSTLLGFISGFMRVVMSLASWVIAVVVAIHLSPVLATWFPEMGGASGARYLIAFAVIVLVVLIIGALLGWVLYRLMRAVGLGFLDRLMGAVVGMARGVLIVVIGVLVCGLSDLPKRDWWQNAWLAPPLVAAATSLKPWLPRSWAEQIDFGKSPGPKPVAPSRVGV